MLHVDIMNSLRVSRSNILIGNNKIRFRQLAQIAEELQQHLNGLKGESGLLGLLFPRCGNFAEFTVNHFRMLIQNSTRWIQIRRKLPLGTRSPSFQAAH